MCSLEVKSLGCWYDAKGDRAIQGDHGDLGVRGCYEKTKGLNHSMFGVSNGLHCYTSSTAGSTYKKYGQQVQGGLCYRRNVEVYEIKNSGKLDFQNLIVQGNLFCVYICKYFQNIHYISICRIRR